VCVCVYGIYRYTGSYTQFIFHAIEMRLMTRNAELSER